LRFDVQLTGELADGMAHDLQLSSGTGKISLDRFSSHEDDVATPLTTSKQKQYATKHQIKYMNASVDAKQHIAPGTGLHTFIGWAVFLVFGLLVSIPLTIYTLGILPLIMVVAWVVQRKLLKAKLHGSALRVDENQFPQIHAAARNMSERLGLAECPEIYIVEDNHQNAFAVKHGSKRYIVLIDDIVHGALATGNSGALDFILGHELAHHALGHTSFIPSLIHSKYPPLARLNELSCDAVAHALVDDKTAARDALALLLVGPQLFAKVNREALDRQAREVVGDKYTKKAERNLTHPLLLRRYARLDELARN
jgi:Zn-dependent protease with chaperone function